MKTSNDRSKEKLISRMLQARAYIAEELFQDGEIERIEAFRLEMDAALNVDTGDIRYKKNCDFQLNEM